MARGLTDIVASAKYDGTLEAGLLSELVHLMRDQALLGGCKILYVRNEGGYVEVGFQTLHGHLEDHLRSYAGGILAGFLVARGLEVR